MLKIYAKREQERFLALEIATRLQDKNIKARIVTSFPIAGVTCKVKGSNEHKVVRECYDDCDGDATCVPHLH